jgi:hypothetical protein
MLSTTCTAMMQASGMHGHEPNCTSMEAWPKQSPACRKVGDSRASKVLHAGRGSHSQDASAPPVKHKEYTYKHTAEQRQEACANCHQSTTPPPHADLLQGVATAAPLASATTPGHVTSSTHRMLGDQRCRALPVPSITHICQFPGEFETAKRPCPVKALLRALSVASHVTCMALSSTALTQLS